MLKWIFDIDFEIHDVSEEYLSDFIILVKLVQIGALDNGEADSLLQTTADVRKGKVPKLIEYPENINTRALRLSFFYAKVYKTFHSCLSAVGIKNLEVRIIIYSVFSEKFHTRSILE